MTALAALALAVAAIAATGNWWSRFTDDRRVELVTKPLTMLGLIVAAVAIEPADETVRWWFVAALVASLAGDVLLLDTDRFFVAGLASFLLAHVLYAGGFVVADDWRWGPLVIAFVPMTILLLTAGRRIASGAATRSTSLVVPVLAYFAAISAMLLAAAAAGNAWAVAGAALFVVSDTILGWNRFVRSAAWMPLAIMITYHLGQLGLVLSLL